MLKKHILEVLNNCDTLKVVNYNSRSWNGLNGVYVLELWKSKDGKNKILIDFKKLEWCYI